MRNPERFFLTSLLAGGCLAPPTEVVGAHKPPTVETPAPMPTPSSEFLEEVRGLKLEGDELAIQETREAMWLLKWGAPSYYDVTLTQLRKTTVIKLPPVEAGDASYAALGTEIEIILSASARSGGIKWLAAGIAHEACHVRQYTSGSSVWPPEKRPYIAPPLTGGEEKECLGVSYDVLNVLGADRSMLDYTKSYLDKL